MTQQDDRLRQLIRLIPPARALRDELEKGLNLESYEGIGDTAVKSYRGLQEVVASLVDDPYVTTLALEESETANDDRTKVARTNLVASQLVAYLEGQTGLVGLGGDTGTKQYAPWINIAGINAPSSVVEKAMSVAGAKDEEPEVD